MSFFVVVFSVHAWCRPVPLVHTLHPEGRGLCAVSAPTVFYIYRYPSLRGIKWVGRWNQVWYIYQKKWYFTHFAAGIKLLMPKNLHTSTFTAEPPSSRQMGKRKAADAALGKEWLDPTKIPVEEIAEEWRAQSKRGRYEAAMWRVAAGWARGADRQGGPRRARRRGRRGRG